MPIDLPISVVEFDLLQTNMEKFEYLYKRINQLQDIVNDLRYHSHDQYGRVVKPL